MATWDDPGYYYSGQGVLLASTRDAEGKPEGFFRIGNVPTLSVSVDQTTTEHKESQSGARATDLRLTTETNVTFSAVLENFSADNLKIALRANVDEVIAGSVTDEPGKIYFGKITAFDHVKVSTVVIKKGLDTLVEYVDDDTDYDYKINLEAGSIEGTIGTPATVGLTDGDDITYSYSYDAQRVVSAITEPATDYYLRFEGLNTAVNNEPVIVEFFKISPDILSELAFISDEVQQMTLEGSVLSDALRTTGSKFWRQIMLQ